MISQYTNQLMSSLLLYVDHKIQKVGSGHQNTNSIFYDVTDDYSNYYTYAAKFQPFVADSSIPGATIITGIYYNSSFITTGTSGFYDINYKKGQVFFNQPVTGTLSGSFALADFHVELTSEPEETLLFETKFNLKSKTSQTLTGISPDSITYPIIYLRNNGGTCQPFQFGGTDLDVTNVRAMIIADSLFQLDAALGIFKEMYNTPVPLIPANEFPYNAFGGLRSGVYNYDQLTSGHITNNNFAWVDRSFCAPYNQSIKVDVQTLNPDVFAGFVELSISTARNYRT